jgi:hypothetical protein
MYKRGLFCALLQEDDKGYEMAAGKIPTGYVKIEVKNGRGKLTAYAQNVKYGEKVDYRMLLIAPLKKTAVDMGRLMVDGTGRGELNIEFDADNVMKSGMDISEFMVAAVQASTAIPLSGYTGRDKVQWKNSYHIINKQPERIDKQQEIQEVTAPIQEQPVSMPQLPKVDLVEDVIEYVVDEVNVMPVQPKKEPVPVQVVTEPVVIEPIVQPEPEPEPILEPMPIPMPEPMPMPEPIVEPAPIKVEEMLPMKPLFEAQTEIKAKFVIEETQKEPPKQHYSCDNECPKIDYKDYYYEDECEKDSDSDSDSDSDDRDKKKKKCKHDDHCNCKDHHDDVAELDYEKHPFYSSPMYRRLEKVLGRLSDTEPFEEDDSKERWYKVGDDIYLLNSVTIPFMGSLMPLGYPFMSNECVMMQGRRDYLIGVRYTRGRKDKKYIDAIMFGIPGMYNKQEERYYSMRGFTHFRPHKSKNHGYWIMIVDLENGEIIMK